MTPFRNIRQLFRGLVAALGEPEVQAAVMLAAALIVFATIFYRIVEGWSLLDSAYFSVVTIATVGYGDFSPKTALGKIFTMGYIFTGIGIFVAAVTALAQSAMRPVAPPAEAEENSAAARRLPLPTARRLLERIDKTGMTAMPDSPLEEKQPNPARDPVRRWTAIVAGLLVLLLLLQIVSDRTAPASSIGTVEGLVLPISPRISGELKRSQSATTRSSRPARCSPRSTRLRFSWRSKRRRRSSSGWASRSAPRPPTWPPRRRGWPRRRQSWSTLRPRRIGRSSWCAAA